VIQTDRNLARTSPVSECHGNLCILEKLVQNFTRSAKKIGSRLILKKAPKKRKNGVMENRHGFLFVLHYKQALLEDKCF